jgi:hypothetical protein
VWKTRPISISKARRPASRTPSSKEVVIEHADSLSHGPVEAADLLDWNYLPNFSQLNQIPQRGAGSVTSAPAPRTPAPSAP